MDQVVAKKNLTIFLKLNIYSNCCVSIFYWRCC